MGLHTSNFPKEYADLGGYFAKTLWAHTYGNDEMSYRKIDMLMIIDKPENFDWGKYLVRLLKEYQRSDKKQLTYQIHKLLESAEIFSLKPVKLDAKKFKKPSRRAIADLSDDVIDNLRGMLIESFINQSQSGTGQPSGSQPKPLVEPNPSVEQDTGDSAIPVVESDHDFSLGQFVEKKMTDLRSKKSKSPSVSKSVEILEEEENVEEDVPLVRKKKSTTDFVPEFNPSFQLQDEDVDVSCDDVLNIVEELNKEHAGGSSIHLDADIFREIDEYQPCGSSTQLPEDPVLDEAMNLARGIFEDLTKTTDNEIGADASDAGSNV